MDINYEYRLREEKNKFLEDVYQKKVEFSSNSLREFKGKKYYVGENSSLNSQQEVLLKIRNLQERGKLKDPFSATDRATRNSALTVVEFNSTQFLFKFQVTLDDIKSFLDRESCIKTVGYEISSDEEFCLDISSISLEPESFVDQDSDSETLVINQQNSFLLGLDNDFEFTSSSGKRNSMKNIWIAFNHSGLRVNIKLSFKPTKIIRVTSFKVVGP